MRALTVEHASTSAALAEATMILLNISQRNFSAETASLEMSDLEVRESLREATTLLEDATSISREVGRSKCC